MKTPRILYAAAPVVLGGALVACSTILGFEDVTLDTGALADGGGATDGSLVGDATGDGGTGGDAATDGATSKDSGGDGGGDGGCTDTMNDGANCGRCGHSCLGGTCSGGQCQPVTLQTGLNGAFGIAVDATRFYVTVREQNQVWRGSKIDGSGFEKLADQPDSLAPSGIAIDDKYVYWTNRSAMGEVRRCLLAGCTAQNPSLLVANAGFPTYVRVAGSYVYWAENLSGIVARADRSDAGNRTNLYVSDSGVAPTQIAVDDRFVYSTDDTGGAVIRIPFDGGAAAQLNGNNTSTTGIALSDAGLFFIESGQAMNGALYLVAAPRSATPSAASFAAGQAAPTSVVADERNVYWVDNGSQATPIGTIMTCPLSGCPGNKPIVLATQLHSPAQITQDADALYFTEYGLDTDTIGSVKKLAKP